MKKKIIIIAIIAVIVVLGIFLLIFNKDSNKLKRYLKKEGYSCNSKACTKLDRNIQYQILYKTGTYRYEDETTIIEIDKEKATISPKTAGEPCYFIPKSVKGINKFTEDEATSGCQYYLEKVNGEVEKFQLILVKSKTDINKLK